MKEHQKEVKLQEGCKYTSIPAVPRDSNSQSRIRLRSQITSTQRITSSTVTGNYHRPWVWQDNTRWIREASIISTGKSKRRE